MIISATKVLGISLSRCYKGSHVSNVRKLSLRHNFSEAKQETHPRSGLLGLLYNHHCRRTYPGFRRSQWLCAGG